MTRRLSRAFLGSLAATCLLAGGATAGPYGWTISDSDSDPYVNTGGSGLLTKTVYLWLACDAAKPAEGVQSAEFGILCSPPARTISSFTPAAGFTNSGVDPSQPRLSAGCVTGPRLAGSLVVNTGTFGAFSLCIVFSSGGKNETVTCEGNVYSNDVVGYSTSATPCGNPAAMCLNTDVSVSVDVDNSSPIELSSYQYTVKARNLGPLAATGVQVADSVLSPLIYESHVVSQGTYNPATGIWNVGNLAISEADSLTITAHAGVGSAGSIYWNRASRLSSSPFDPGSGRANDVDSVSVDVQPRPQSDLRITKSVLPAMLCEGDSATFTIIVGNGGPNPATSVQATDLLRPGMTYVAHTVTQGSYDVLTGAWSVGNLAVSEEDSLAITVTVDAGTAGTSLVNVGSVATLSQEDTVSDNDADSTSVLVRFTGSTATFEAATIVPDSAATLRIDFGDDSEILDATLFYRNGGDPDFTSMAMDSLPASGTWEAIVPGVEVGHTGMQVYAQVTSFCTSTRVPATGFVNVSARIDDPAAFVLPLAQYALLGVPFHADDMTPTGLFDELAPYDTHRWRYGTWNGTAYGDGPGQARNALPGQGFWIYAQAGATIAAAGWTTTLAQDFGLVLQPGWNQVANPFGFPLEFTQLGRPAGVSDDLVSYDGTGYVHFASTLEPGKGYWIRNTTVGPIALIFPASPVPPAAQRAPTRVAEDSDSGWELGVTVEGGPSRDAGNLLGMRADAVDGLDDHDYADAPAPPGAFLLASFSGPDGRALQTDFRALREPGASWDLDLVSTLPATPFRIVVSRPQALPDGWEAVILDPTGLGRYAATDGAQVSGRTLFAPESQAWHLIVGTPAYVEGRTLEVQAGAGARLDRADLTIAPNPVREGRTALSLTLPAPDLVRLTIYDVAGRLVRELHSGPLPAGLHRLMWDPAASRRPTPAGVYFVRLETSSDRVARKIVVR